MWFHSTQFYLFTLDFNLLNYEFVTVIKCRWAILLNFFKKMFDKIDVYI